MGSNEKKVRKKINVYKSIIVNTCQYILSDSLTCVASKA